MQAKPHIGTDILAKVIKNMRDYLMTEDDLFKRHSGDSGRRMIR